MDLHPPPHPSRGGRGDGQQLPLRPERDEDGGDGGVRGVRLHDDEGGGEGCQRW